MVINCTHIKKKGQIILSVLVLLDSWTWFGTNNFRLGRCISIIRKCFPIDVPTIGWVNFFFSFLSFFEKYYVHKSQHFYNIFTTKKLFKLWIHIRTNNNLSLTICSENIVYVALFFFFFELGTGVELITNNLLIYLFFKWSDGKMEVPTLRGSQYLNIL